MTQPIFIGIAVGLKSLGLFYCVVLFCYDFVTVISYGVFDYDLYLPLMILIRLSRSTYTLLFV